MHTLPLNAQSIKDISEEAAYGAGKKNPDMSPADVFPHVYQALEKHLGSVSLTGPGTVLAADIMETLHAARVALDNCVQVFTKDLDGLRLIQPELECSREALAKVETVINQLQPEVPVPVALLDDLRKLNGLFPYDDATNVCRGDARFADGMRRQYGITLINQACDNLNLSRWAV